MQRIRASEMFIILDMLLSLTVSSVACRLRAARRQPSENFNGNDRSTA